MKSRISKILMFISFVHIGVAAFQLIKSLAAGCGRQYFISAAKYCGCSIAREAGTITANRTPVSERHDGIDIIRDWPSGISRKDAAPNIL